MAVEAWSLRLHVAAGTVALLAGTAALLTSKGGRRHRLAGKLFLASMGVTVATVFVLLAVAPTSFRAVLGLVAVFSGYLAFSGYRSLAGRRPAGTAGAVDWVAAAGVVVACLGLGAWGLGWLLDGRSFGVVMAVFGGVGVGFGLLDARQFHGDGAGNPTVSHLQRMVSAYIATVSAVSAVNLTPVLGVAAWLWPTVLGVPLVFHLSNRYDS